MKVPFSYVFRNLWTRKLTTLLTAGGMALVVFVFSAVLMLDAGLKKTLVSTGSFDNAVLLRQSAQTEVQSSVYRDQASLVETMPGIARGPHEHVDQADYFCFTGPSTFRVYLWDTRKDSPSFGAKEMRDVGENAPFALIVPAGIVHAYKNVGTVDGWVFNAANRLYGGWLKQEPPDEIRHENDANSPFRLD